MHRSTKLRVLLLVITALVLALFYGRLSPSFRASQREIYAVPVAHAGAYETPGGTSVLVASPDDQARRELSREYEPSSVARGAGNVQARAGSDLDSFTKLSDADKTKAFEDAQTRGKALLCKFSSPANVEQSAFTDIVDLRAWGWRKSFDTDEFTDEFIVESDVLKGFYDDRQLRRTAAQNIDARWVHRETTIRDEQGQKVEHLATKAYYFDVMNAEGGLILAHDLRGPKYAIAKAPEGSPIRNAREPKLRQWSDVVFLAWQAATSIAQRSKLRYVLHNCIVNDKTLAAIEKAFTTLGGQPNSLPRYPGRTFQRSSDPQEQAAFEALVGSPNAQGISWLLLQHWDALGQRTIKSITVWQYVTDEDDRGDGHTADMVVELAPARELRRNRRF